MPSETGSGRPDQRHTRHHAVFLPWPGQGHISPLMHLAKRLARDHDFSIAFVNQEYTHARVISSSLRQQEDEQEQAGNIRLEKPLEIKFVCLPDGVSPEDTRTGNLPELCKGTTRGAQAFEQLLENLDPPATVVISDTFVLHTQDACNKLGIPRVSFWTQSAACFSAHNAAVHDRIHLPPGCMVDDKAITTIAGVPPLRLKDVPGFLQRYDLTEFMFNFATRPFLRTKESACVLLNTFDDIEGGVVDAIRKEHPDCTFYTIGPVLPADYFSGSRLSVHDSINKTAGLWAENYSCLEWLDRQAPSSVLYVSFGSITELSDMELEEFALGLEASGMPLLWVLRPGLLENGGPAALPPGFEERSKGRVLIIDWAPQLHVLAHPSVGAFLTHGGWNSTLEGIAQGLPMLGFPYFADQMLNCHFMEDVWGNGLAFERHGEGLLTRSLVEAKVRALMADPKLRDNAIRLRDAARRAARSQHGASSISFQHFLEHIISIGA